MFLRIIVKEFSKLEKRGGRKNDGIYRTIKKAEAAETTLH